MWRKLRMRRWSSCLTPSLPTTHTTPNKKMLSQSRYQNRLEEIMLSFLPPSQSPSKAGIWTFESKPSRLNPKRKDRNTVPMFESVRRFTTLRVPTKCLHIEVICCCDHHSLYLYFSWLLFFVFLTSHLINMFLSLFLSLSNPFFQWYLWTIWQVPAIHPTLSSLFPRRKSLPNLIHHLNPNIPICSS